MTLPRLPLVAALFLTACGSGGGEPAAEPARNASAIPAPVTTVGSLEGEYRVAGIDGEELDAPVGIAVSITESKIELAPCAGFAWTYTLEGRVLETRRIPVSPDEIICRITEESAHAGVAMAEVTRVRRTAANGLEFSGGGRSVLLFSQ